MSLSSLVQLTFSIILLCTVVYNTNSWISLNAEVDVQSPISNFLSNILFLTKSKNDTDNALRQSNITLRQYLSHPDGFHLGMAPSFFGFYGYFGALIALEDEIGILPNSLNNNTTCDVMEDDTSARIDKKPNDKLLSVAGASAGAMAAVLLSAGIHPRIAADFTTKLDFNSFADPPGWFALLKGQNFESIMKEFLMTHHAAGLPKSKNTLLEESIIPVAVSSFDIRRMRGKILTHGCMAKAARASATFPLLFQPTKWLPSSVDVASDNYTSYLIDGGLTDPHGLLGLTKTINNQTKARIMHLSIGKIYKSFQYPLDRENVESIATISIVNTPSCGPWAMENGIKAVHSARVAILNALDLPMHINEDGNYELRIDASAYS